MLIRLLNIVLISLVLSPIHAQVNLVPNPGFDEYDNCPTSFGDVVGYVKNWEITVQSPDYFNGCSSVMSTPQNSLGYQNALSGTAYMGAHIYSTNNQIGAPLEMFHVKLKNTLFAGKKYCVSFFVSPADTLGYYIDCFGAYFSKEPIANPFDAVNGSLTPQVSNLSGNIIKDTMLWTEISGNFIAEGDEKYITLGCFKSSEGIDTMKNLKVSANHPLTSASYYYYDNIYVAYCDEYDLAEIIVPNIITPNQDGINDMLILKVPQDFDKELTIIIYNRWGAEIYRNNRPISEPWDGRTQWGALVSSGTYYYVIYDEKNTKGGFVQVTY